jgi:hypothetical protein
MLVKTLRKCFGLGILIAMGSAMSWSKETPPLPVSVTVAVHDDAAIGLKTVMRAEEVAWGVFREAGIEVQWLNCGFEREPTHGSLGCAVAVFPTNLQLRIRRRSLRSRVDLLGVSYLSEEGTGCYSEVFVEPAEDLRRHESVELTVAELLGHAMAHEIGHLLLGSNAHSVAGIMRGRWGPEELLRAAEGTLSFNERERVVMRERLSGGAMGSAAVAKGASRIDAGGKD